MKRFLDDEFLLQTNTAQRLYHDHAERLPIFDYHCHLPPTMIAEDHRFADITEAWLAGDHYKWRAMRANGVAEHFITGDASAREKFQRWAETVPYTIGNPLYHWTHLEMKKPFGIRDVLLDGSTAEAVWSEMGAMLGDRSFSCRGLLQKAGVRYVGTTDDPTDDLSAHRALAGDSSFDIVVLPSFRPDRAYAVDKPDVFAAFLHELAAAADRGPIARFDDLVATLIERVDYFHELGCRVSDHALTVPVCADATESELTETLRHALDGRPASPDQHEAFCTAVLAALGAEYARRGWVMQFHIGALRNANSRMYRTLGPDTGFDSMADGQIASPLARLLARLDDRDTLPKTIIYVLNPRDNELAATMIGNFQDGTIPGKIQFGSGWWFNDQKDGMERQMNALANMGLLRRFVGMLTDSRSFLSFPRHEYFRRTLCNLLGTWVEAGEAPNDARLLGELVEDICWNNAVNYFGINVTKGEPNT